MAVKNTGTLPHGEEQDVEEGKKHIRAAAEVRMNRFSFSKLNQLITNQ